MPVFDFNNTPDKDKPLTCTYTTFRSDESTATPERPMLVLDNKKRQWKHHSSGFFSNPAKQTTFEFEEEDGISPTGRWQRSPARGSSPRPPASCVRAGRRWLSAPLGRDRKSTRLNSSH